MKMHFSFRVARNAFFINNPGSRSSLSILNFSGIFLNMVICGALFRDLEWTKTFRKKSKHKIKGGLDGQNNRDRSGGSSSTLSSPSRSSMPEVDELRTILESGDITALFSPEELSECQARLSSSLVNLPTFLHCNEPLPDEVINAFSRNEAAHSLILRHFPNSIIAKNLRGCSGENDPETEKADDNPEEVIKDHQAEKSMIKLKRKVSSLFKTKPRPILKKPPHRTSSLEIEASDNNTTKIDMDNNAVEVTESLIPKQNLHHLRVRKQSLTYRGAMLSIPRYRLRASSCPDIYRNSITTIAFNADEDQNCCQRSSNGLLNCFKEWKEFINPAYLVFALSNFILYAWYDVMYVYLYNYAEMDLKFSSSKATFLLSVIGILNTLGEVIIGWLGDQSWMNLNILYAFCMIICGGSTALVPFLTDYYSLSGMAGLYGFCISANYALTSPILVNLVSLEQFSNAYGLLLLVQGISNLIGKKIVF